MHHYALASLLLVLSLPACASRPEPQAPPSGGQTFPEAVAMMCDVDKLAGLSAEADPLGIGQSRTDWITQHVDNPDAIELRTLLSVKGATEQSGMLRDKAKQVGQKSCTLADSLEKEETGGLSP